MATYINSIPGASQLISASQPEIQGNFAIIDTGTSGDTSAIGFSRNHYSMTDPTNGGFHYAVTFPSPPGTLPSLSGTQSAVYPKLVGSAQQLFFANAVGSYQLSNLVVTNSGSNYGISTPWGIKINWGTVTASTGGAGVTFAVTFGATPSIVCTAHNTNPSNSNVTTSAESTTGFTCYNSNNSSVFYIAIGT